MPTKTYDVYELEALLFAHKVYEEGQGPRRWSEEYEIVFRDPEDNRLYRVYQDRGLTESHESDWPDAYVKRSDPGTQLVDAVEVEAVHTTIPHIEYVEVAGE